VLIAAPAVIAVAGAVAIAPRVLSLHAQSQAQSDLGNGRPRAALADATTALDYDGSSAQALILRSAGFARLDDFPAALADLRQAISIEPRNWATWALLGDLFTRRGYRGRAHAAYARALALDPLESSLQIAVKASLPPRR
jgi:Flp pilus assembly protein TadD